MSILSEPSRTLRIMSVNPWQRLAEEWPRVALIYSEKMLPTHWGESRWKQGKPVGIVLNHKLTQVQRRCALAHELEHFNHGAPCGTIRSHIERRVLKSTALYLLPNLDEIADALADNSVHAAAEDLWVTWSVLVERLRTMSDADLDFVASRRETIA